MSGRTTFLATGFALTSLLSLGLIGAGYHGYRLHEAQAPRLAALEADAASANTSATADGPAGQEAETLRLEIRALRIQLAEATANSENAAGRAARELEALRLKLANAEQLRADSELALAASRSRIVALEAEIGLSGGVDQIIDAAGQPDPADTPPTPAELARLGTELRLVEREREGARLQLDRALQRIAELEAAPASMPSDGELASLLERIEALTAENRRLEAERDESRAIAAAEQAMAETARDDLDTRLFAITAASQEHEAESQRLVAALRADGERVAALEEQLAAETAELAALRQNHAALSDEHISLKAVATALSLERDDLKAAMARLGEEADRRAAAAMAERESLTAALAAAEAERDRLLAALDRQAEAAGMSVPATALEAEREAAAAATARAATLEAELAAAREALAMVEAESAGLEATVQLATEITANGAPELDEAIERIKSLNGELETANARNQALQRILLASWPGPPRPAPRDY